jgi:N-acyl-L-homoserine lactone synthetase
MIPTPSDTLIAQNSLLTTQLTSTEQIDDARALLYRIYHEEQHWSPHPDNPSGQRTERLSSGQLGFVDQYDHTCTWIGLVCNGRVVGCVRLIDRRGSDCRLELENYFTLPGSLLESAGELLEVNRLALAPEHRGGHGLLMITGEVLSIAQRTGKSLITAGTASISRYSVRYGGMADTGLRFTYHVDDPEQVLVLLLVNQGVKIGNRLQAIQRSLAGFDAFNEGKSVLGCPGP